MSKKLLIKYIFMYIPFIVGVVFYSSGVVNLFSSLLLFVGGYVALKNTLDYRLVKKNIDSVSALNIVSNENGVKKDSSEIKKVVVKSKNRETIRPKNCDDIVGIKRTRRYTKVRRRY